MAGERLSFTKGGVWKLPTNVWVDTKVNDTWGWKPVQKMWVASGGLWKQVWPPLDTGVDVTAFEIYQTGRANILAFRGTIRKNAAGAGSYVATLEYRVRTDTDGSMTWTTWGRTSLTTRLPDGSVVYTDPFNVNQTTITPLPYRAAFSIGGALSSSFDTSVSGGLLPGSTLAGYRYANRDTYFGLQARISVAAAATPDTQLASATSTIYVRSTEV